MPRCRLLDLLPVEIFHMLFGYFSAHEILLTFSDVSDYIDGVLLAYPTWHLNLKSIRRDHFDVICQRIQPENVISLTLSDDIDTSGQSELFFRRFRIEQFGHLRSLTLVKIEFESLNDIFSNLHKLEQLISLSFEVYSMTHKYLPSCNSMGIQSRQLRAILLDPYTRVLPRLTRLCVSNGFDLKCIPLLQLRHLKLVCCQQDELQAIVEHAPVLQSLDVGLTLEHQNPEITLVSSQLTRLSLTIAGCDVSMDQMEEFLPNLPQLKHLELVLRGGNDLSDGYRWQKLANSLITFNFKFDVDSRLQSLESFRTPFWQEEKCWHVDYQNRSVFSVPRFSTVHIDIDKRSHPQSTTTAAWFTSMNIQAVPDNQTLSYPHIKSLSIDCSISLATLRHLVILEQIKHLSIRSITDLFIFQPYESMIPTLYELRIKNAVTSDEIKQIENYQFKQIRKLTISINDKDLDFILKELFYYFPHIEYLTYSSAIDSMEILANIIDGFVHLLNATFYSGHLFYMMTMAPYSRASSIMQASHRLTENNFTYRLQRMPSFSIGTHWWIAPQPLERSLAAQQPLGLHYIWHWMKHLIFSD